MGARSNYFCERVGAAGTTNQTVRLPKNFTLKAPGPGYTCGRVKLVKPSKYITPDGRRMTQAMSKLLNYDRDELCCCLLSNNSMNRLMKMKVL